jgi:4a-hydroxytetrahydrobiopterin dehydratase
MQWTESDGALHGEHTFTDFAEAFAFLTRVALIAQRRNHHPDMAISWNKVTLTLSSHDAGNVVTDRDRELASEIGHLLSA